MKEMMKLESVEGLIMMGRGRREVGEESKKNLDIVKG